MHGKLIFEGHLLSLFRDIFVFNIQNKIIKKKIGKKKLIMLNAFSLSNKTNDLKNNFRFCLRKKKIQC